MPARKARGAIVEKGEKGRKVIGDYLNNPPYTTKTNVGGGVLPKAVCQLTNALADTPYPGASPLPHFDLRQTWLLLGFGLGATLALGFEQADTRCD